MCAMLGCKDIEKAIKKGKVKIIPFNKDNLKGASYDISPTIIALSTRCGMLEKVYCDREYPFNYYIYIKAKDTVLVIGKEYISVPENIAGYVISRVSNVVAGMGHVCTSIDPNWKGAPLIALSNPTNKNIKVYVGCQHGAEKTNPLATVTLHYLNSKCEKSIEYTGMRMDLLERIKYTNRQGFRAFFYRMTKIHRRKFTDFFFRYCEQLPNDESHWNEFLQPLIRIYYRC